MDDDDSIKRPDLKVIEGNIPAELVPADKLVSELQTKTIPGLQSERQALERVQFSLGLRRDPKDIYRRRYAYPEPLTARTALEKAVDKVGGEYFVQERRLVDRLENLEHKATRSLEYFQRETKRCKALKPNHFKKQKHLVTELSKRRNSLNAALNRYNNRVEILNQPENQTKIRNVAESLLKEDVKTQLKRIEVERKVDEVAKSLEQSYKLENQFRELGKENVLIRRASIQLEEKKLSLPSPANPTSFDQQLAKVRQKNLTLTRTLSK